MPFQNINKIATFLAWVSFLYVGMASATQICADNYYWQSSGTGTWYHGGTKFGIPDAWDQTDTPNYDDPIPFQEIVRSTCSNNGKVLTWSSGLADAQSVTFGGSQTGSRTIKVYYEGVSTGDAGCNGDTQTTVTREAGREFHGTCVQGTMCEAGEPGGSMFSTEQGQEGCDQSGCAIVTHARTDDSLAWGAYPDGLANPSYIAETTMVGGQCTSSGEAVKPEDYDENIDGVTVEGDPNNADCAIVDGEQVCSAPGTGNQCYEVGGQSYCVDSRTNCVNTTGGGRICAVNPGALDPGEHLSSPGVPNDGSGDGQTPATPDLQLGNGTTNNTTINYYGGGTVAASDGDVGDGDGGGDGEEESEEPEQPGECDGNADCDPPIDTDEIGEKQQELYDEQTKDATAEQGWQDPDVGFFNNAPMIQPTGTCPTVNATLLGKDFTFPSPGICAAFGTIRQALAWLLYMLFIFDTLGVLSRTLKAG